MDCIFGVCFFFFSRLILPPSNVFLIFSWLPEKIELAPLTYQSVKWVSSVPASGNTEGLSLFGLHAIVVLCVVSLDMLILLRCYCILQSMLLRLTHLCPSLFVISCIPSTWDHFSSAWRAPLFLLVWVLAGKLCFCLKISLLHYPSWNIFSLHMEF